MLHSHSHSQSLVVVAATRRAQFTVSHVRCVARHGPDSPARTSDPPTLHQMGGSQVSDPRPPLSVLSPPPASLTPTTNYIPVAKETNRLSSRLFYEMTVMSITGVHRSRFMPGHEASFFHGRLDARLRLSVRPRRDVASAGLGIPFLTDQVPRAVDWPEAEQIRD